MGFRTRKIGDSPHLRKAFRLLPLFALPLLVGAGIGVFVILQDGDLVDANVLTDQAKVGSHDWTPDNIADFSTWKWDHDSDSTTPTQSNPQLSFLKVGNDAKGKSNSFDNFHKP